MPLMPFKISSHILPILSGAKKQTTRAPRKNPLKLGDKLYCYYKPRQKKGCRNCITTDACKIPISKRFTQELRNFPPCDHYNNFFGEAKITGILHLNNIMAMNEHTLDYETQIFKLSERWIEGFDKQSEKFMEAWAKADGFSNLQEANEYFTKSTKNSQWMFKTWDVILFEFKEILLPPHKQTPIDIPKESINSWDSGYKCEHEGCLEDGSVECHIPNHLDYGDKGIDVIKVIAEMDKVEHLCQDHAYEAGYCTLCGEFWGGVESFDFNNPQQLCENCLEQLKDEIGENDEEY